MSDLRLKVDKVEAATQRIRSLKLVSADGQDLPGYAAGAHLRISLPSGGDRPYSLISSDLEGDTQKGVKQYRLGVLREQDGKGGSRFMHELCEGDILSATGPECDFHLGTHDGPAILIAGGIGITPILSMASELQRQARPFALHYSGRTREAMAFLEEIESNLKDSAIIHCDDEPECCLDLAGVIASAAPESHFYICGPRGMIEAARERARQAGFPGEQIHFELFEEAEQQEGDQAFEVELSSTGQCFTIPPGKSIIEVLEEAGVDLVYDCQRGDCGICQTGVLEGEPDHRDVILSDDERAANDVMQICVSRAKSSKLVLDL